MSFMRIAGKITVYLGKRDFIDHLDHVDPIDGIIVVDNDYLKGRKIYGQASGRWHGSDSATEKRMDDSRWA